MEQPQHQAGRPPWVTVLGRRDGTEAIAHTRVLRVCSVIAFASTKGEEDVEEVEEGDGWMGGAVEGEGEVGEKAEEEVWEEEYVEVEEVEEEDEEEHEE